MEEDNGRAIAEANRYLIGHLCARQRGAVLAVVAAAAAAAM